MPVLSRFMFSVLMHSMFVAVPSLPSSLSSFVSSQPLKFGADKVMSVFVRVDKEGGTGVVTGIFDGAGVTSVSVGSVDDIGIKFDGGIDVAPIGVIGGVAFASVGDINAFVAPAGVIGVAFVSSDVADVVGTGLNSGMSKSSMVDG